MGYIFVEGHKTSKVVRNVWKKNIKVSWTLENNAFLSLYLSLMCESKKFAICWRIYEFIQIYVVFHHKSNITSGFSVMYLSFYINNQTPLIIVVLYGTEN